MPIPERNGLSLFVPASQNLLEILPDEAVVLLPTIVDVPNSTVTGRSVLFRKSQAGNAQATGLFLDTA